MKRGLLLIDRGSREREASEELEIISAAVKEKGGYDWVDFCFLEVVPPFIEDGMEVCMKQNLDRLTIIPYFLYPGKKVKVAVADVMKYQKNTTTKFLVGRPMSMHPTLAGLVESRIRAALDGAGLDVADEGVDVLVIGHGSMDPNAQMSLNYIVDRLRPKYRNVERCYLEIEQPDIAAGVEACKKNDPEILVIVFYFLHEGAHVKTDINAELGPALQKAGLKNTYITKHLGADQKMIDLILERAGEVENAD